MLVAFGKDDDSREAFDVLRTTLSKGDIQVTRTVGYRDGNVEREVTWHAKAGIWSLLDDESLENRFWCCFGVQDPQDAKSLDIAVEINPRLEGTDLLVAGAFARDIHGTVHLCHNGKIGGGRQGIGKSAFLYHYRGRWTEMAYGDKIVEVVDLGPINSRNLPGRLGRFAQEISRVKEEIAAKTGKMDTKLLPSEPANGSPGFVPEFSGVRRPYSLTGVIEANADHGKVVDVLAESVENLGYGACNDRARDLFILDERKSVAVLFEVKTDVARQSIYAAVGQLLLNGGVTTHAPRMILVVPGRPEPKTREALGSIGIEVLAYEWQRHEPLISKSELRSLISRQGRRCGDANRWASGRQDTGDA